MLNFAAQRIIFFRIQILVFFFSQQVLLFKSCPLVRPRGADPGGGLFLNGRLQLYGVNPLFNCSNFPVQTPDGLLSGKSGTYHPFSCMLFLLSIHF